MIHSFFSLLPILRFTSSNQYWKSRYIKGGNSGAGSYGDIAKYKAKIINQLIKKRNIKSVIDFGCGDGNQLSMLKVPNYVGLDISIEAIGKCINRFAADDTKSFFVYDYRAFVNQGIIIADLVMSLDVIYHLTEDHVYRKYIDDLFRSSKKYVLIFSSNDSSLNASIQKPHVRHRKFTDDIDTHVSNWKLIRSYPPPKDTLETSASFYLYVKK